MLGTCWEIIRRDVAGIGANLAGNLIGFIVCMVCCVLVFLFVQNNLSTTNTLTDHNPKQSVPLECNHLMLNVPTLDAPSIAEGFCMCDMFSFPLVTDVRNNSVMQEQRTMITHPMIQRHLDRPNQPVHSEQIDQVNCPDKPPGDLPTAGYCRIDHRVKYKSISEQCRSGSL